jgi:quinoprotein glucose dehydrogenase
MFSCSIVKPETQSTQLKNEKSRRATSRESPRRGRSPFQSCLRHFIGKTLSPEQAWGSDDSEREACRQVMAGLRYEGIFTPPSLKGTMIYPGYIGGVNWGSAAADPARGIMTINLNDIAFWVRLIPRNEFREQVDEVRRIYRDVQFTAQSGTPYAMARGAILSPKGNPCVAKPWGKTVAVNLNTGAVQWESPSTFGLGGPIMTAGGLVFTAAAVDQKFRALDADTGKRAVERRPAGRRPGNADDISAREW